MQGTEGPSEVDLSWLNDVRVGYDGGFVIVSRKEQDLGKTDFPFQMKFNGWGQLRHTVTDSRGSINDLNEFQLKRGRLVFSTSAFNSNFSTFVQLDGRSSSGDDIRLLDYFLSWDVGHARLGLERGQLGFRTGKYKVPFTMARWLSGRDFEFADRSVASTYFDVNRSFAWGVYGRFDSLPRRLEWEFALFNGLVTGGAETGSSGSLDDNFAVSGRAYSILLGEWGYGALADFECHEEVAMRIGCGFASTQIDRDGTTEFDRIRVVDSGDRLSDLLPLTVERYSVSLFALDASLKYRGWSTTLEYYFRNVGEFPGAVVPDLYDHGFWYQLGYFVIPRKLQLISRWSRVVGNSGTLGVDDQSSEDIAGGFVWYFLDQHAKVVGDFTYLDGAPINSSALDISPGQEGWLFRTQFQFSF